MKKILQFSKFYPPAMGGIEQVAWDIVKGINHADAYHCDVLCFHHEMLKKSEVVSDQGAKIFRMKTWKVVASTPLSISIFHQYFKLLPDYDIVHIHVPNPLATLAAVFTFRKKMVVHWHSDIVKQKLMLRLFRPLQNIMLKKADVVVVTSDKYGAESEQLKNYRHKLVTVPIGIEDQSSEMRKSIDERISAQYQGKKIIFSLGRLAYYKGFEYLIKSAHHLPDDYLILIGGGGELRESLQQLIDDNHLNEKVMLVGRIPADELASYYRLANIFCMSSVEKSEAFGVVQLEAMSHALPVVSTRIPGSGVDWVNLHGVSGLTVAPRDEQALARAFISICDDNSLAEKMSTGARTRYLELFTATAMCSGILAIYGDLT